MTVLPDGRIRIDVAGQMCPWPLMCRSLPNVPCFQIRKLGQMCACEACVAWRMTKVKP